MSLLVGIIGMACILLAFVLDEFSYRWSQNTLRYNFLNSAGSLLLLYYAYSLLSWPFMILNAVWFIVAGYKIFQILQNRR